MKRITIAVLLLMAILSSFVFSSCVAADVKHTVHLTIKSGTYTLYDKDVTVSVPADSENGPSVLDILNYLIDHEGTPITMDNAGTSVSKIGLYYNTDYQGVTYYWSFKINGAEPKAGKADTNYVVDGDTIEYSFVAMTMEGKIFKVTDYDNTTGIFESVLSGEK